MKETRPDLRGPLRARLTPLLVVLGAAVGLSAPLAFHRVGAADLRDAAHSAASEVAALLAREAEERPRLWRYDSIRMVEHLSTYRHLPHVSHVEVVDAAGARIASGEPPAVAPFLWERAPIEVRGQEIGAVWVAMNPDTLRARSLELLAVFSLFGAALAFAVHLVAIRSAGHAEDRIEGLVDELAGARAAAATRDLAARALSLQEEERRGIARDLHDAVGQGLTALRIHAELALARAEDRDSVQTAMRAVRDGADQTLEELRRALDRLGPAVVDEVGLRVALERLALDIGEQAEASVELHLGSLDGAAPLSAVVERTAYRIAQEALANVVRHAVASQIRVAASLEGPRLQLLVEDDGVGIDPDAPPSEASRGLRGMRERAELMGGKLTVEANEPRGTRVRATLPLG